MRTLAPLVTAVALAGAACSPEGKAEITDQAFDDPGRRTEMLEATLRVLDAHPDYVDELFQLTLRHPRTLDRLLANTARGVEQRELARRVAGHLTAHPDGLREVMIATLDAARDRRKAQGAIVDAMEARAPQAAVYLVDHPTQMATVSRALVKEAVEDPQAREKMTALVKDLID